MKTPTTREIAAACGVNPSTVSRALANHKSIPEATRNSIRTKALKMGWKRNPLAAAYMAHLRSTQAPHYQASLAYVIPYEHLDKINELPGYQQQVIEGARREALRSGYQLETIWLKEVGFDVARLARLLKNRGIPGVILHGSSLPEDFYHRFDWNSFAAVTWGFSLQKPRLHRAAFYMLHGLRLLLQKLRELRYTRIALILSENQNELADNTLFVSFYYAEKHHSSTEWLKSYRLPGLEDMEPEQSAKLKAWILENRPEVIIGEYSAWKILKEMQLRIPEDIAFVSPHWSPGYPEVGGIDHCAEVIGSNAMDMLTAQLLRNERGIPAIPKLMLNEGIWMDGPSIPPRTNSQL